MRQRFILVIIYNKALSQVILSLPPNETEADSEE